MIHDDTQFFDATPYLKLTVDKDGRWFQNGAEITHPAVRKHFMGLLERTVDGGYRIRSGREICAVEVEDTPFVVTATMGDREAGLSIALNDDSSEPFDPELFWIGKENTPYTRIKGNAFSARFSRPAYYQLTDFIEADNEEDFFFVIRGVRTRVRRVEIN